MNHSIGECVYRVTVTQLSRYVLTEKTRGWGVIWISKLPAVLTRTCATNVRAHQQRSNLILLQKYSMRNYWVNNSLELVDYVYELVKAKEFQFIQYKITLNYYFFEILILNHILFFSKLILQTRKRCACCLKYWNFFLITVKVPWSLILFS